MCKVICPIAYERTWTRLHHLWCLSFHKYVPDALGSPAVTQTNKASLFKGILKACLLRFTLCSASFGCSLRSHFPFRHTLDTQFIFLHFPIFTSFPPPLPCWVLFLYGRHLPILSFSLIICCQKFSISMHIRIKFSSFNLRDNIIW